MTATRADERIEATVTGTVQGVGFRWFAVRKASELGLKGWTSNESDGSVKVVAEGPTAALDELVAYLKEGPSGASVQSVDVIRSTASGEFSCFGIRSGAHRGD